MEDLHRELVKFKDKMTFDELSEILRPKESDEKWDFYTLEVIADLSIERDQLVQALRAKFGRDDLLASVLEEAKSYDPSAEKLQHDLVAYFVTKKYPFEEVVDILKLGEGS
ncbi:hypothetical protein PsorP6_015532 [Peronosclerospora sorghi]|uniref:Uncharacterized protein n=1 Tax=Peronosclerospora sorghi TaxID=230839 RepID=A0ACC0WNL6_9STRA|nr:hypothetical protein PsorP6_015532 [Peronosclerospora sorghi]